MPKLNNNNKNVGATKNVSVSSLVIALQYKKKKRRKIKKNSHNKLFLLSIKLKFYKFNMKYIMSQLGEIMLIHNENLNKVSP